VLRHVSKGSDEIWHPVPDLVRGGAFRRKGFRPGEASESIGSPLKPDCVRPGARRRPFVIALTSDREREGAFRLVASRIAPSMSLDRCLRAMFVRRAFSL